jgi:hypothetical protein
VIRGVSQSGPKKTAKEEKLEVERLLRHGAYDLFQDDEGKDAKTFNEARLALLPPPPLFRGHRVDARRSADAPPRSSCLALLALLVKAVVVCVLVKPTSTARSHLASKAGSLY